MNWAAIILFAIIVVVGESNRAYETKIVQYHCPTNCMVAHEHIQLYFQMHEDSLRVASK